MINARVFTQDPLEQHFSKLRAAQGGSNNPSLGQALRGTGNSGECYDTVEVTTKKLQKLKSSRTPQFVKM